MKTSFWKGVRGGSPAVRILSTYVALVFVLAIAGPGLSAYAANGASNKGDGPPESRPETASSDVPSAGSVLPGTDSPSPPVPDVPSPPVTEVSPPEPVVENAGAPQPSIETPLTAPGVLAPMLLSVADPNPGGGPNPNSFICAGGVKLDNSPRTGTYTWNTAGTEETPTTPSDYSISIVTYQDPNGLGMLMDFVSNYPVTEVTVKGGTPSQVYTYDPPVTSGVGLHAPVNDNNGKYFDISHIVFCFGQEQPPVLSDLTAYKFEDLNSNGVFDDEPMLAGWAFTIYDAQDAVVGSGTTDSSGKIVFSGLTPGVYHVTETLTSGWTNTTPLTQTITLPSETPWLYFGNIGQEQPPVLSDLTVYKFEDLNSNGVFDDEPMLAGWAFTIYDAQDAVVGSGTTDSSGKIVFSGLTPGVYHVTETLTSGWTNTTPLTQTITLPSETLWLYFGNIEESLPFTELDLAIAKSANKTTASPGELITYTLVYRNLGDLAAQNYTIVDNFDERYVTVVDAAGGTVAGGAITWTFPGPLTKADGAKSLTYTVRVIAAMPVGTTNVDNVVVISHPRDENLTNNTANARVVVRVAAEEPFLPFTGGEYLLLLGIAFAAAVGGLLLRVRPVRSS